MDASAPIDATGQLMDGTPVDGPGRHCGRLLERRRQVFVGNLTEKLLAYALGGGIEYSDMPDVRRIVHQAAGPRLSLVVDRARRRQQRVVSDDEERPNV